MGDSMTDFVSGVEAADEHRDIDADFAHLREIMESRSFRTNSGLAGEQPYYIYDYPPRQELEVAEHIRQLVSQLQTMTPKYDGDYAPQVLTLDLFDVVLEILGNRGILDRVLNREAKRHRKVSSDAHTDKFLGLLDNVLGADTAQLPDTIRDHYEQAKSEGGADIVFITGIVRIHCSTRCKGVSMIARWYCFIRVRSQEALLQDRSCRCSTVCRETITIVRKICVR